VGPLEAGSGAEVDWASVWQNPHRLFITSRRRTRGSKPKQRGLTQVLRRPAEITTQSGRFYVFPIIEIAPGGRNDAVWSQFLTKNKKKG